MYCSTQCPFNGDCCEDVVAVCGGKQDMEDTSALVANYTSVQEVDKDDAHPKVVEYSKESESDWSCEGHCGDGAKKV